MPLSQVADSKETRFFPVKCVAEDASLPAWQSVEDDNPYAFLNYIIMDNNMQFQKFDIKQVGEDAEIPKDPGAALTHPHQKLELEVEVEKEGYIYVYFSNEDM